MDPKPVVVIALIRAKPGKEAALKEELLALIPPTRQEQGCLAYELHQDQENPARFVFYERWADKSRIDAHLRQPHLQALVAKADTLLGEPLQLIFADKIG
jgi:quinol monooxygenase YgiN